MADTIESRIARALELWRRVAVRKVGTPAIAPDFSAFLAEQGLEVRETVEPEPDLEAMAQALIDAGYQVQPPA